MNTVELQEAVSGITNQWGQGHNFWQNARLLLKHGIENECVDNFMEWPIIQQTMFIGSPEYVDVELKEMKESEEWESKWKPLLNDPTIPANLIYDRDPSLNTCGNTIHHLYHLYKWEEYTGKQISDIKSIFEIGAGYGNTARIIKQMDFKGSYIIADLPEFAALQEYYLDSNGINTTKILWNPEFPLGKFDLFISEWSLSEMPENERQLFWHASANHFLVAYSNTFEDMHNTEYFNKFLGYNPETKWLSYTIPHIPNSSYMFGKP